MTVARASALVGLEWPGFDRLGAVLFIRPDIGAASLAIVFGLYSIFYGVVALMAAYQVRELEHTVRRTVEALS